MVHPKIWEAPRKIHTLFYFINPQGVFKTHSFILMKSISENDRRNTIVDHAKGKYTKIEKVL